MELITSLTEPGTSIAIDASVAINLVASGHASQILRALPHRLVAVDVVQAELEVGRRNGKENAELFDHLVAEGLIEIAELQEAAQETFENLVVGAAAATLDDGEAATIAYAHAVGAVALIDERKANRICAERYPELKTGCTIDIFGHSAVEAALGRNSTSDAVLNALKQARMRVLPHHLDWVLELIGHENIALCPSLPRSARGLIHSTAGEANRGEVPRN